MASEFARNIQDATLAMLWTLPNGNAVTQTNDFDLGTDIYKPEECEFSVAIPALTEPELGAGETLTVVMAVGATPGPTTPFSTKTFTGSANGLDAQDVRFRLPSNCPRYVSFLITGANGAGDMSNKQATIKLAF